MLTTVEAERAQKAVERPLQMDNGEYTVYRNKLRAIEEEWGNGVYQRNASDIPYALHENLFQRAWEDGHSDGFESVENHYIRHAQFAREVITTYLNN